MQLNTLKFGLVEIDENLIFNFAEPILGYENLKKYALIDYDQDSPFKWLQSIEEPEVAFPVTIPALFGINYVFTIPENFTNLLNLKTIDDVLTVNIVNIPVGKPENSTVNLLAPIIINIQTKAAIQIILQEGNYSLKQNLFQNK